MTHRFIGSTCDNGSIPPGERGGRLHLVVSAWWPAQDWEPAQLSLTGTRRQPQHPTYPTSHRQTQNAFLGSFDTVSMYILEGNQFKILNFLGNILGNIWWWRQGHLSRISNYLTSTNQTCITIKVYTKPRWDSRLLSLMMRWRSSQSRDFGEKIDISLSGQFNSNASPSPQEILSSSPTY